MIPIWKTKKLTFLLIPEANKQVRRFRVPLFWMYLIPSACALLVAAAAALAVNYGDLMQENTALEAALQTNRDAYAHTVAEKDETIDLLQEEIVRLSQEAEKFAAKIAELQKLEQNLLTFTEQEGIELPTAAAFTAPVESVTESSRLAVTALSLGMGGEFFPFGRKETLHLSEDTMSKYEVMTLEADRLEAVLTDAIQEAEELAYIRGITPSIYPTLSTRITSTFGYRKDPFTKKSAYHKGIDFGGSVGDPVFATASGTVEQAGYDSAMGNYIYIDHGNGLETVYMHLSKLYVKEGQNVKKGEKIGALGNTGRSTGPHLHYEVHKNGKAINPRPYVNSQEG